MSCLLHTVARQPPARRSKLTVRGAGHLAAAHGRLIRASLLLTLAAALIGARPALAADPPTAPRGVATTADTPVRVVYQVNEGPEQAVRALNNIRNHLAAEPGTRIVVVGFGAGMSFLVAGAKDPQGIPFDARIHALAQEGVEFRACSNTMRAMGLERSALVPEAVPVPAGVAEVAHLQFRDGYAYLRP